MNLSNEKNTLLNTVSRFAVDMGARASAKFVTRGAMAAAALTVATYALVDSAPAIASCSPAVATADGGPGGVICSDAAAGGFNSDGYDNIDLDVRPDSKADGLIFAPGAGEANNSDGNTVIIFDTDPAGFNGTNAGLVNGAGDGVLVDGDSNLIRNGTGSALGGGTIQGTDDGVDITGINNEVTNINNGFGGPSVASGLISGGGGANDDGVVLSGGTSGNVNTINNGMVGSADAFIISGGTTGAVTGDDGVQTSGWSTINNGIKGKIAGDDRGIEFVGTAAGETLTIDNDGTITGDVEDGILVAGTDGVIVNYSGDGTVKGGSSAAGIDIAPNMDNATVNVTFGPGSTGLVTGGSNGIELGDGAPIASNGNTVNISGAGTVSGDGLSNADGIHVYAGTGNTFNIEDGATVEGEDDGIDLGSGNTLLVDDSTVTGDTDGVGGGDGIQADDGNDIHVTNGSTVTGDPGMLVDDDNVITIDGGSSVTGNPEDGINADDGNEILVGGAGGAGTVNGSGPNSDGIALTDEFDNSGGGSADDNKVTIGDQGTVDAARDGIVVGQVDTDNERNEILIEDGGNVIAGEDGIVVNAQDEDAEDNTVTIEDGGEVNAGGDGVRLLGDNQVTTGLGAITGGGGLLSDGDGEGNDLDNDGIIRAGDEGVLVSNTNSDVRNQGGEIYAGHDGVRFTTIHTDAVDGDTSFPGESESGYQSDGDSVIVAGRDGIHYDNYADDAPDSDFNAGVFQDVNGLGEIDDPIDLLFGIKGYYPEVVENEGVIEAGRHGISVNDDFAVTNGEDAVIVAGGLPGEGGTGGDGIHADANNYIENNGTIATGADAGEDSHGIEVDGESNSIYNDGLIDTRGDTLINEISNTTLELGDDEGAQDNGAGGDGIHAGEDGLTLGGATKNLYDQQEIVNSNTIIAADDGIDVQSGLGIAGGEQLIDNDDEATITADDDGIVAENYNIIWNEGVINADDDGEDGGDGIDVNHSNVVKNDGDINSVGGNGIVMEGAGGPFADGNTVINGEDGDIVAGEDGIQANGDLNKIFNSGNIKGGEDGVDLSGTLNSFSSDDGTIEGGSGAGIYSDDDNDIVLEGDTTVTSTAGSGGDGIFLGSDNKLDIRDGVTVTGDDDGLVLDGDDNDVDIEGGEDTEITGRDGDGIDVNGNSNTIDSENGVDVVGEDDGIDISGDTNAVDIDGNVSGEDDGILISGGTSNVVTVGEDVTGDSDNDGDGDGVEISGGGTNTVTVGGTISGDPGVLIENSNNNGVTAGDITATQTGVQLTNADNNTVTTTVGGIEGDNDGDGTGDGVNIDSTSTSNVVSSADDIRGEDAVSIAGDDNQVSADDNIEGEDDGVVLSGDSNIVTAGNNISGGEDGLGVHIQGNNNEVTADGDIAGGEGGILISGDDNDVDAGQDVLSENGHGVEITGDDNTVDVGNEISADVDGVVLSGDDNKVTADSIDAQDDGVVITGDDNDVEIGSSITAGVDGVRIEDGAGNTVDLDGVDIDAGEDGIQLDNADNTVEHDEDTTITAGDDGVELNYGGTKNVNEEFDWEGTINAADDGIVAVGGFMSIINKGTINADTDGHVDNEDGEGDGDGIVVASDSSVTNDGTITGWRGIVGGSKNVVTNDDDITAESDGVFLGDENTVINNDTITSITDDGIDVGDDNYVENNSPETINAADNGIEAGSDNEIVNNGTINADTDDNNDGDGINADDGNKITNNGDITGWNGITVDGSNVVANNLGATIVAENAGIDAEFNNAITNDGSVTATDGNGVELADFNSLTNTGSVLGDNNGVSIVGEDNFVNNDGGSITATDFDAVDVIGEDNTIVNTAGGTITGGDDGVEIQGDSNSVTNAGTIAGNGFIGDGVFIFSGTGNTVWNQSGGSITGQTDGVEVETGGNTVKNDAGGTITGTVGDGVDVEGGSNTVDNSGTIDGADDGVAVEDDDNLVYNYGTVTGGADGVQIDGDGNYLYNDAGNSITGESDEGVEINGEDNTVDNYGTITGFWDGVEVNGEDNTINNYSALTIIGQNGDGIDINGDNNDVFNTGSISGEDEGIAVDGDDTDIQNGTALDDSASILGANGDGIDINSGEDTTVTNWGLIQGEWEGIDNAAGDLTVTQTGGTIQGANSDGIRSNLSNSGFATTITNNSEFSGAVLVDSGVIVGEDDGIDAGGASLTVNNGSGSLIEGQNGDGISTGAVTTTITNSGSIEGEDDGIYAYGTTLKVTNSGLIEGEGYAGIHTHAEDNTIDNSGIISGEDVGIADGGSGEDGGSTYIQNTGLITGTEAGYLYEGGDEDDVVQIDNKGTIEVTGLGDLPAPLVDDKATKDVDESKGTLDFINGEDANPVAAIDTRFGEDGLEVFIFNWDEINGANEFTPVKDDPLTKDVDESKNPPIQATNRFAILGGEGNEYIANFDGGTINGDVWTQAGNDILALEIGSTLNGDVNLGQTLETTKILGKIVDNPATKDVDEFAGGTAVGFVETKGVDVGIDTVILFGEGYQSLDSDIVEAEILYVNDLITQEDVYGEGPFSGEDLEDTAIVPVLENQPTPVGTWSINGNVKVDGTNLWTYAQTDLNGDGDTTDTFVDLNKNSKADAGENETLSLPYITGTVGTVVDNGRLNVGATEPVLFEVTVDKVTQDAKGVVTDKTKGDGVNDFDIVTVDSKDTKVDRLEERTKLDIMGKATLTSPVVDVWSGGTLGGHGTIITNPGANGGNGGVNLSGAVQGDRVVFVGASEENIFEQELAGESRGILLVGTGTADLVTQDDTGKVTDATKGDTKDDFKLVADGPDEGTAQDVVLLQYTKDAKGNFYPGITLPANFKAETFTGAFDQTTDSPRYATLAPGDEINRIGKLTVVGNVTMDDMETKTTTYVVNVVDDPATKDDEFEGGTATKTQTGRTVVTNWGSQFQADLKDDGTNDLLYVKKSGVTSAFTGSTFDITGPGVIVDDPATKDVNEADVDQDGIPGETIGFPSSKDKTSTTSGDLVAGKGKADGIPDGIAYKTSTVLDGRATVDGRLDIRLDGEFVDLVDNSELPTIPSDKTGCGNDPDDAKSCAPIPNPAYNVPDGIADVDAKGISKNNADFSKDAKVWDIIIAEGGVSGKFDEKGFDGGPNDGAVVVRYDDPETAADEELRVQLLKAYLQYLPDRVRIISIPAFAPKGTTINQIATAEYLDSLTKYGLNEDALHAAVALVGTASDIPAALDALHPEWYNAFNEVGFSIARGAEQQAYIRTIEAQGFSGGQQNRVVMNVGDDSAVGSSASDRRATFWLAGSWGNASIDDGSDEGWLEYKYETLTGYAGFDYLINPNFLLGILGGFSNSDVDAKNASGNEGDVDSWQVGGYISYFTQSWFLNAGGGIGDMNIESIRNIQFGSGIGNVSQIATADYDGDITYFYGKGGYSFDLGNSGWKLSPELALSYAKVKQDGFSETGTGNAAVFLLDVEGQSVESLRGTAQLRLSKTFLAGNGGGWMPYVRVGVANEFEDDLRPITSGFQGAPGTSFTVFGQVPRETTVIFGAGVSGKVSEMFSLYLDYSGEIGGSFTEHVISGGVRLHF